MAKVTYLFGAGASANVLPVIKDVPDRLKDFFKFIHDNRNASNDKFDDLNIQVSELDAEEQLMQQCQDLIDKVKEHESIDTYAKKLRITGDSFKYKAVKSILSSFFIYEQLRQNVDKRYDSFFASILETKHKFNGNIRILSWNYDFQFEKAYSAYSGEKSLYTNQAILNVYPSGLSISDYKDGFGIFKINGTTGYNDTSKFDNLNLLDTLDFFDPKNFVKKIVWFYVAGVHASERFHPLLSFAWEANLNQSTRGILDISCEAIKDTDVLVVIGYSIPFFNREIDKRIVNSMAPLKKIYVQDLDVNSVVNKLTSILPADWNTRIIPINYTNQFYLPPEL